MDFIEVHEFVIIIRKYNLMGILILIRYINLVMGLVRYSYIYYMVIESCCVFYRGVYFVKEKTHYFTNIFR